MLSQQRYTLSIILLLVARSCTTFAFKVKVNNDFLRQFDCGWSGRLRPQARIVRGIMADPFLFPWIVFITPADKSSKRSVILECTGSFITRRFIISAAHCSADNKMRVIPDYHDHVEIIYGTNNVSDPSAERASPVAFSAHPDFNTDLENDIMLIDIGRRILDPMIRPLCMSTNFGDVIGNEVVVAGFGLLNYGPDKSTEILWWTIQRIISYHKCMLNEYIPWFPRYNSICAYLPGKTDSCFGDSGGPMMIIGQDSKYYLIGIVSSGTDCASPNRPALYTNVTNYNSFIFDFIYTQLMGIRKQ